MTLNPEALAKIKEALNDSLALYDPTAGNDSASKMAKAYRVKEAMAMCDAILSAPDLVVDETPRWSDAMLEAEINGEYIVPIHAQAQIKVLQAELDKLRGRG